MRVEAGVFDGNDLRILDEPAIVLDDLRRYPVGVIPEHEQRLLLDVGNLLGHGLVAQISDRVDHDFVSPDIRRLQEGGVDLNEVSRQRV